MSEEIKRYTVEVQESGEDCIIPIPEEIWNDLGLKVGDTFDVNIVDGAIELTKNEE